jgi:anti-sigma regulatory factor (Ser/Thr protein kinase)
MTLRRSSSEMAKVIDVKVPAGPEGARRARQQLARFERELSREVMDNLRLMVSELVTNSIRHAGLPHGTRIALKVQLKSDRIRVEVTDPGPGFDPTPVTPSMYQTSGWGLYLVDQLSDRWGVIRNDTTNVWFELDRERQRTGLTSASSGRRPPR